MSVTGEVLSIPVGMEHTSEVPVTHWATGIFVRDILSRSSLPPDNREASAAASFLPLRLTAHSQLIRPAIARIAGAWWPGRVWGTCIPALVPGSSFACGSCQAGRISWLRGSSTNTCLNVSIES